MISIDWIGLELSTKKTNNIQLATKVLSIDVIAMIQFYDLKIVTGNVLVTI